MSTITFITELLTSEIIEAKNMTYQLVNDFVVKVVAYIYIYIYIISLYMCVCVFLYRIKAQKS